MEKGTGNNK